MLHNPTSPGVARPLWRLGTAAVATLLVAWGLGTVAFAGHPEVSLPGSNFEIDTDANLKVDDPGRLDWANAVGQIRKEDKPSGSDDDSFGQGTKEDTAVPTIVTGSIPPNKSDLKFFGVYQEGTTSDGFLHLFWTRVQEPKGSTNMDFEFNQNKCDPDDLANSVCSANGVTPVRSVGDLLIAYDLKGGTSEPVLSLREWTGSQWGPPEDLSDSAKATGSINSSTIPAAESDGLGELGPRTFGEASIDLSAIFGDSDECLSFGSAYLKSRASDQFNSALKDFIAPVAIDISNCGSVKIIKTDDAGDPLAGAVFTLFVGDDSTDLKCTTVIVNGKATCTIGNVFPGEYQVVETVTPPGHVTADPQNVTVVADETVKLTFVNVRERGAILVTKTRKHAADGPGDHPHPGVKFTVTGSGFTVEKTTDASGQACFDGLDFGDYTVTETVPDDYVADVESQDVTVGDIAGCDDDDAVEVEFHNTPLSTIIVTFVSQVEGGTKLEVPITCVPDVETAGVVTMADPPPDTATFEDLLPGTYVCTVVIDP